MIEFGKTSELKEKKQKERLSTDTGAVLHKPKLRYSSTSEM